MTLFSACEYEQYQINKEEDAITNRHFSCSHEVKQGNVQVSKSIKHQSDTKKLLHNDHLIFDVLRCLQTAFGSECRSLLLYHISRRFPMYENGARVKGYAKKRLHKRKLKKRFLGSMWDTHNIKAMKIIWQTISRIILDWISILNQTKNTGKRYT